jgi:hypothetical protein
MKEKEPSATLYRNGKLSQQKNVLWLGIDSHGIPFEKQRVDNCNAISILNINSVTTIYPVCWFSRIMRRRVNGNPIEKQHYHHTIMATLKQKFLMGTLTFH